MQDEINLLEKEIVVLENDSRKLNGLYDESGKEIQILQNKLDTCEKGAIFGMQSNSQVCELKIEGIGQKFEQSFRIFNINDTFSFKISHYDHSTALESEKKSNIAMIEQLNRNVTLLTGDIKEMQNDKETGQ